MKEIDLSISKWQCRFFTWLVIRSSVFWANRSFFAKNEWIMIRWAICSKKERFTHLLILGKQPERVTHIAHFWWATWVISLHCSLKKREWANRCFLKSLQTMYKKTYQKYDLSQIFWANHSFFVSERANERFAQKNKRFPHSLDYHEQPERTVHSRSFDLSDLSEWANSQPWFLICENFM